MKSPALKAKTAVIGGAFVLAGLSGTACVQNRVLEASEVPASVERNYPVGAVEPLGFAADLKVSAPESASASNQSIGGLSSNVYRYPMRPLLEDVFQDYFVASLFSVPFEGEVASAFRVEVNLKSARTNLQSGMATTNLDLEVRILGAEFKEELFRQRVTGTASSNFTGTSLPEAVWEAAYDAAEKALLAAAGDHRLSSYVRDEPLYEFQNAGPSWTVAVFPFEVGEKKAGLDDNTSSVITNQLISDLLMTNRFTILEQEKLEELMKEQRFQQSGFTTEVVAAMGQALGARYVIFGKVTYHSNQYSITFRLVDVETRQVLAAPVKTSPKAATQQLARVTRRAINEMLKRLDSVPGS